MTSKYNQKFWCLLVNRPKANSHFFVYRWYVNRRPETSQCGSVSWKCHSRNGGFYRTEASLQFTKNRAEGLPGSYQHATKSFCWNCPRQFLSAFFTKNVTPVTVTPVTKILYYIIGLYLFNRDSGSYDTVFFLEVLITNYQLWVVYNWVLGAFWRKKAVKVN